MTTFSSDLFSKVREAIEDAHLIAYDGCHKIYLAMDEIEAKWFRENYGYEDTLEAPPEEMLDAVYRWWADSCPLKFVSAVYHNADDPNEGFVPLIEQFAEWDDEENED